MPTAANVERNLSDENRGRMPWGVPIRDAGTKGEDFVPGGLNHRHEF